jgi:hypothetical protein
MSLECRKRECYGALLAPFASPSKTDPQEESSDEQVAIFWAGQKAQRQMRQAWLQLRLQRGEMKWGSPVFSTGKRRERRVQGAEQ